MYLFIFESVGTSELILIGIVALIFLGPRKMPEYARKIGKMMNEFRSTTSEFKQTWEREVDFSAEANAFRLDDGPSSGPVARVTSILDKPNADILAAPSITEVDPAKFSDQAADPTAITASTETETLVVTDFDPVASEDESNDKRNWL